jgi:hypothetical protein
MFTQHQLSRQQLYSLTHPYLCGFRAAAAAAEVNGLRYFDKQAGRGKEVAAGDTVVVSELQHLHCCGCCGHTQHNTAQRKPPLAVACALRHSMPWVLLLLLLLPPQVHFDCKFRGIDAVSSRYARTLGGNRTIAEVR